MSGAGHRWSSRVRSPEESFWERVVKADGCWSWTGSTNGRGYGEIRHKGKKLYAHRLSYEIHFGEFPRELEVCHGCDNPECTNPEHLFLGTHEENMLDQNEKGRCPHGSGHYQAKLTESDVLDIRDRAGGYGTQRRLAEEYGISEQTVCNIVKRRCWKHI